MSHEDPIGRRKGDSFVRAIMMLCIGCGAVLVAVVAYTAWTMLVA